MCVNCLYLCVIILICPSLVILLFIYNNSLLVPLEYAYTLTGGPNISQAVQIFQRPPEILVPGGSSILKYLFGGTIFGRCPIFDLASMLGSSCGQTVSAESGT